MFQETRFAARSLRKSPGFTSGVVLTIALAIGVNVSIFSILHSTLIKPLPFPDADRVVFLWKQAPGNQLLRQPNLGEVDAWRQQVDTLESIEAYSTATQVLTGLGDPGEVRTLKVSADLFAFLGIAPAMGRVFTPVEVLQEERLAVVSHAFWKSRLAGDAQAVGRSFTLDGERYEVVGVLPAGFRLAQPPLPDPPLWLPLPSADSRPELRAHVIARLREGSSVAAANAEFQALAAAESESDPDWVGRATPPTELLGSQFQTAVPVLQAAVGLLLLISCANVGSLLLARGSSVSQEMAVRSALGASRPRLAARVLAEAGLLATAGGIAGLALANVILPLAVALRPARLAQLDGIRLDAPVYVFAAIVTVLSAVAFGVLPAIRSSKPDVADQLKGSAASSSSRRSLTLMRAGLVVAQVTITVVLLVGAGLMISTFRVLTARDPGLDPEGVASLSFSLPKHLYPSSADRAEFHRQLDATVASVVDKQGAKSAVLEGRPPSLGIWFGSFAAEGEEPRADFENTLVNAGSVGPDFFAVLGIPIIQGREFNREDHDGDTTPVVISADWARQMWNDSNVLGRHFSSADGTVMSVVGIMPEDSGQALRSVDDPRQLFLPLVDVSSDSVSILVRSADDPLTLLNVVKEQVWAIDPEIPITSIERFGTLLAREHAAPRFDAGLMSAFALMALVIATLGVYSVLNYAVAQRTRELGMRMALGAQRSDIVPLVLKQGLTWVGLGLAIGLAVATGLTRYLESLLTVSSLDATTYVAVAILLLIVACSACLVPARRAARLDPLTSLRAK